MQTTRNPEGPAQEYLSLREAAKALNLSETYLRRKVRSRTISFRRAGTKLLFSRQDLDDFMGSILFKHEAWR